MDRRKGLYFFGVGAIATALTIGSGSVGCQSDSTGAGGASETTSSSNPVTTTTTTNSGSPTTSTTSTASLTTTTTTTTTSTSTASSSPTSSTGTASGTGGSAGCVSDQDAMISDVAKGANNGGLGAGIKVQVSNAVVMSQKFLVSQSSTSGSCLWGIFLSAPGLTETAAFSGVLALSYGTPATTHMTSDGGTSAPFCPTLPLDAAGDAFPDDLAPGDVVTVIGKTDIFPATAPQQVQLSNVCNVTVVSRGGPVPTPAVMSDSDAVLFGGNDGPTTSMWAGVKFQLAKAAPGLPVKPEEVCTSCSMGVPGGCDANQPKVAQDGCHRIFMQASNIEITTKLLYNGLLNSLGVTCQDGLLYTDPATEFTKVAGFGYLDFTQWAIAPAEKCQDLTPGDSDCTPDCKQCVTGTDAGQCGTE